MRKLYALLLEDVQKDVELLAEILTGEGFELEVDVVEAEQDFVQNLKRHNYDIIFADFTLPSFNGQEALILAKKICPNVPFICISGTIGEDRAVELLKQGATDYVLKDRMERLPFATKRALDAASQLQKFRQTEIELQTNRKLLQTIINNALDLIYIKDINGNYILLNHAAEKAYGKNANDVVGKDDFSVLSKSDAKTIMEVDKEVIAKAKSIEIEENITLADGLIHTFHTIKSPMFDEQGKITGLFGIARDVTESKKAEKILHETQEMFKLIHDSSIDAILLTCPDGRILSANPSACRMFGRSEEEICRLGREGLVDTSDPKVQAAIEERARTGWFKGELTFIRKDNTKFLADVTSAIFKDKEGQEKTSMIIRDITEQKKAEEAINLERKLLRTLINNLSDAIYVKDNKGRKLIANTADLKIMNCSDESEVIGKTDRDIFPNSRGERGYNEDMEVILTGNAIINKEDSYIDAEGKEHWRLTTKIPLFNEQKQIFGLVGFGHDITERKKFEEQLLIVKDKAEASDRLKTAFMQNISHEVRTPLNGILGFAELIANPNIETERKAEFYNILSASSNRLLNTITDYMDMSLIVSNNVSVQYESIKFSDVLSQLNKDYQNTCISKNLNFNIRYDEKTKNAEFRSDPTLLAKIINHMVDNAIKFTKEGSIFINFNIDQSQLEFTIKDTGIGISKEAQEKIFDVYTQESTSTTRGYEGSGLGLSIVNGFLKILGGKIRLNSEKGAGAEFYITLPINNENKPDKITDKNSCSSTTENNKLPVILIVEDDFVNYTLFEAILEPHASQILYARNGLEAIEICQLHPEISIVLMDVKMPVMNGLEATKEIKNFRKDLP
ncbi:MAG TPA: PAS domain S-box protein, partial [Bacteroidales bacterium]